ncbi:MAG TPA: tetratricopeptide repeat protein [Streptosporangiaceae bacterium]
MTAAKATNPWVLAGADGVAAVIFVFSASWQECYRRGVQRRDDQEFCLQDGCLVLADGRLPTVREITNPVVLGVHPAAAVPAIVTPDGSGAGAPAYVPRDVDDQVRERLAAGGFVLLVGDSTAGKSRMAFEAVSTLPAHVLICPANREALAVAVDRAAAERRCVLWLDDLERYLGAGGLTPVHIGRLLTGSEHHRVVIATIRAAEQARVTAGLVGKDAPGAQTARDIRLVIGQAHSIRVARMFTPGELERASARDWDPRIADALAHASSYGIAEYLAAGPELLRVWEDARASCQGPHARGAALVAAAIDIRRAGYLSALPRTLLYDVHEHYLADPEHARVPREPAADAWSWATRPRPATTALLRPAGPGLVEVFDYLVDTIQRSAGALGKVPEPVVAAALAHASPEDADSLAQTAHAQGRYQTAEHAYRQAYQARAAHPAIGPDHPDTLTARNNFTRILRDLGRLAEAEDEIRSVIGTMTRLLGPDHPDTLTSRDTFALLLHGRGQLAEAEAEINAVLNTMIRVLGPDHPDTLISHANFAVVLRDLGRLEEAETEIRAVLDTRTKVLGPDHPETLVSHGILATILRETGRLAEAETEIRAAIDDMTRVLGPDHPYTLPARGHLARTLRGLGRLPEAEAELRTVLDVATRVLGSDHPFTLIGRGQFALILRDMGRLAEAETEIQSVVAARNRVLGPGHPDTLPLANALRDLRQAAKPT